MLTARFGKLSTNPISAVQDAERLHFNPHQVKTSAQDSAR
jgi:hypothetical protein